MKITKLSTCEGAERFGTCVECGKGLKEDPEMFKITWNGNSSTILCKECLIKLKFSPVSLKDRFFLNGYAFILKST